MSETNPTVGGPESRLLRRRTLWIGGGVLAGLLAVAAVAAPRAWAYRALAAHGFGGMHGHGQGPGALVLKDPAAAKQHVDAVLELALRGVSASDEQQQQARRIAERVIDQLAPLAQAHRAHHVELVAEFQKPQIDREAVERLRREELALADQASKSLLGGVTDLATVLTPEQRSELIDLARRFHGEAPAQAH